MATWLVYLSVFLLPAYIFRFKVLGIPTNVFEVAVLAAFLVFVAEKLLCHAEFISASQQSITEIPKQVRDDTHKSLKFGYLSAYLFLLSAIVAVYFASNKIDALGILKGWFFVPAILFFLVINLFNKEKIKFLAIPLFISLQIVSIWAILQKFGVLTTLFYQVGDVGFSDYLSRFRAFGPFESPNYLAMFLLSAGFLSLPIITIFRKNLDKAILASFYLLPLYAIYASHSLGGLLAFCISTIAFLSFLLIKIRHERREFSGRKITALAFLIIILAVGFSFALSRIDTDVYSHNLRLDIYRYSLELVRQNPITGVGLGGYADSVKEVSKNDFGFTLYGLSYALHPHNLFLALWLNQGIFGLLAFSFLLIQFFWSLGRRGGGPLLLSAIFTAMMAIIAHGLVDTTYFKNDLSAIFWLTYAFGVLIGGKNGQTTK